MGNRVLRPAAHKFAAGLIEEVRATTGMRYPEVTRALFVEGYPDDPDGKTVDRRRAEDYTRPLSHRRSRVPEFTELQTLENDVAYLLKRPAHRLVIEDRGAIDTQFDTFVMTPKAGISWRRKNNRPAENLAIAYDLGWPTFDELRETGLVELFRWQYGCLWDQGHFDRSAYNFPDHRPIEILLERRVRRLAQTYHRLAGYLHMHYYGNPYARFEPADLLTDIQISERELELFLLAWGPLGLHRWRHLGVAAAGATNSHIPAAGQISAGILPETHANLG